MSSVLLAVLLAAQHQHVPGHSFEDIDRWVAEFESPERDERQKPDEVVKALKLRPSDRVADIGAGTGYFTRRFAKASPEGTVYAVDLEPNMLRYIAKRARTEGLKNVVPVLALPDSPMLAPSSVDMIFICNTIHHIENRAEYYAVLREVLAPGGRIVVVDFRKDAKLEEGPPEAMRLDRKDLEKELSQAGFRVSEEHDFLPDQYFVVFSE
ncbi:MAG TPA: methyltransferase [Vicinamibacteria bacterium]|jgi:ubiquinone/menaquinone biosynthesis C-methylase UbiE